MRGKFRIKVLNNIPTSHKNIKEIKFRSKMRYFSHTILNPQTYLAVPILWKYRQMQLLGISDFTFITLIFHKRS